MKNVQCQDLTWNNKHTLVRVPILEFLTWNLEFQVRHTISTCLGTPSYAYLGNSKISTPCLFRNLEIPR